MKAHSDELKDLKREVKELKKQLADLRKSQSHLVVESLQVVKKDGTLVAEVDKNGNLFCRVVSASTKKSVPGVFLNGPEREIQAGRIHLSASGSNFRTVEIKGDQSYGLITVRDARSKQDTSLRGHGAALVARSRESATSVVTINGSDDAGGTIHLGSAKGPQSATLKVSHPNRSGQLGLVDAGGKTWHGPLPGKPLR